MFTLHAHSNHSLLEGAMTVDELVAFAVESGSGYVALTDTNSMSGLIPFAKLAREKMIKPILGAYIDEPENRKKYVLFLAKNRAGYAEMCRIITSRKLKEKFSLSKIISEVTGNLFMLTSSHEVLRETELTDTVKKNLYVELIVSESKKKETRKNYEFAKAKGLNIVASHPAYFSKKENFEIHKVLTAIRTRKTIENLSSEDLADEEFRLFSPPEFASVWRALPEAVRNAEYIAERCNVDMEFERYKFPVFPLPSGETAFSYLWKIAFDGLSKKYRPLTEKAVERLQNELEVINDLGFSDYFLVVWDIVREAHKRNILTIGRGSAANSLAAYCLNLTQVDPIKHDLYFERFLNRGRTSPPDVDIDFSWKERDEIVRYVFEKYGYERTAMISTTVTFRARSAFRETAKAYGVSDAEISSFSKFIPWTSAKNLTSLAEKFPEARSLNFKEEPWKTITETAQKIAGYPRYRSIHPGGIVITEKPITNYVALEYAENKGLGLIVTQPDMYAIEDYKLIKIDLLSQRSLGVLRDTINAVG